MQEMKDHAGKENAGYQMSPDICVCCGKEVPEGRQVCWECEHQYDKDELEYFRPDPFLADAGSVEMEENGTELKRTDEKGHSELCFFPGRRRERKTSQWKRRKKS